MSAKLKTFVLLLVLVPVALVFTACGGQLDSKPFININGKYFSTINDEFEDYITETSINTTLTQNVKMFLDMKSTYGYGANHRSEVVSMVAISQSSAEKQELYIKLTVKSNVEARNKNYTAYLVDTQDSTTAYIDGTIATNTYCKNIVNETVAQSIIEDFNEQQMFVELFRPGEYVLDHLSKVRYSEQGNILKWALTLVSNFQGASAPAYYNFDEDNFAGFYVNNFIHFKQHSNYSDSYTINAGIMEYTTPINFNSANYTELS